MAGVRKPKFEWSESTVADALETRHPSGVAWVFLRQVPDGTSDSKSRTADAIAMGCWKSVGIKLHGYEIKVSRSDWLREIQDTSKAGALSKYCHFWWVAAPDGIVKPEELPANWGLVVVQRRADGYSARVRKPATENTAAALDYKFFASIMRRCFYESPVIKDLNSKLTAEYERGYKAGIQSRSHSQSVLDAWEKAAKRSQENERELAEKVRQFERESGLSLNQNWGETMSAGVAVSHIRAAARGHGNGLAKLKQELEKLVQAVDGFEKLGLMEIMGPPVDPSGVD